MAQTQAQAPATVGTAGCVMARGAAELTSALRRLGPHAIACPGDVAGPAHLEEGVAGTVAEFGRLDIVGSNAAISAPLGR
ncbi:SDR family oxidoreductase [Streptomyces coffeae]|uniref:SDR family oxidoreductase n=1 Tax=Streptomyces coffeae TaxID=621382 RepID=UPI0027DE9AC5|nr:SDR family oxidoreductase [Streptomyces coffeae]